MSDECQICLNDLYSQKYFSLFEYKSAYFSIIGLFEFEDHLNINLLFLMKFHSKKYFYVFASLKKKKNMIKVSKLRKRCDIEWFRRRLSR